MISHTTIMLDLYEFAGQMAAPVCYLKDEDKVRNVLL
jgi:hypothetical protein